MSHVRDRGANLSALGPTPGRVAPRPATSGVLRRLSRPFWPLDVLLVLVGYAAYSAVRNLVPEHTSVAVRHAGDVYALERRLHLDPERAMNQFLAHREWLAQVADYYYATLHFAVPILVAIWLYRRQRSYARPMVAVWYLATLLGLVGFWLYPLAPPRLSGDGFIDTVVVFHTWGGWGSSAVASMSNQYAAMPSLHMAWSAWAALVLVLFARRRWARLVAPLYPVGTALVVLSAANHWLLDVPAGLAVLALAAVIVRWLTAGMVPARPVFAHSRAAPRVPAPRAASL